MLSLLCRFVLAVCVLPSVARCQEGTFDLERTQRVLTELIQRKLDQGVASISIALVRGDEIVWTAAFGHANVRMAVPAIPETIYVTGSTFKAVTATAILQLVERGLADLDDPINDHLGEHPVDDLEDQPVTLRHLLSHTSGLSPGANTVELWSRTLPMGLAELPGAVHAVRAPGERYEYNNYGYGIAGYLVERISGQEFEDYVVEHVLAPLGIETPGPVRPTPEMVERLALPYVPSPEGPRPVAQTSFDVYPAGDIYLTAEDMARFLGAHLNGGAFQGGRLLGADSTAEAHRPQGFHYALGWGTDPDAPHLIAHTGGVPGFQAQVLGDLEARVGAYVASNSGDLDHLTRSAVALLRGEDVWVPPERVVVPVEAELLEAYVGRYELRPDLVLTITREEARLFLQATGGQRRDLLAASPTEFFITSADADVRFLRNEQGLVDRLLFLQGDEYTANRID
jgi:CubicO group peptidase (beta-lactamase class C family)